MSHRKDMCKLADDAREQGWEVRRTGGDHLLFIAPSGGRVYTSSTPSDKRAVLNTRARLRRLGFMDGGGV